MGSPTIAVNSRGTSEFSFTQVAWGWVTQEGASLPVGPPPASHPLLGGYTHPALLGLGRCLQDLGAAPAGRGGGEAPQSLGKLCPSCGARASQSWGRAFLFPSLLSPLPGSASARTCSCGVVLHPVFPASPRCLSLDAPLHTLV